MNKASTAYLLILFSFIGFSCQRGKGHASAIKMEVPVAIVQKQDVSIESEYPGQTYGESDIVVNTRVEGVIQKMNFTQGSIVKKGQILYQIDALPYRNKVDQAEGSLAQAKTLMVKAKADLERIDPLVSLGAVSQRELVAAKAQYDASVSGLLSAEASLRNAEIELGYCNVTAPISGIIGISKFGEGDFVSKGINSALNTISLTDHINVRFTISEQEYLRLFRELAVENSPLIGSAKNIGMTLSDGTKYQYSGSLNFADRQIDPSTGAMTLEASFKNPDHLLRPGQYVKISFVSKVYKEALLVPQRAVTEMQGIFQVYLVDDSSRTILKFVKPGPAYKDAYIIEEGLSVSQKVIVGGTQMIRPGIIVLPKDMNWKINEGKGSADN